MAPSPQLRAIAVLPSLATLEGLYHLAKREGDEAGGHNKISEKLKPTHDQAITLAVIGAYAVGILILWWMPVLKHLLKPFKLATVLLHEFSHAAVGCCTGARIEGISLNLDEGGETRMKKGIQQCVLPAGYLGSSFFGALMVFAGFEVLKSKIASVILGVILLITLFWADDWLTRGLTVLFVGLIIGLWFTPHGVGLKYFVLFMGVMSCLYSLWDILDDLVFRKEYDSDATKMAQLCCCSSRICGLLWFLISLMFLTGAILGGLAAFKNDPAVNSSK
ncbi:hypothetical protein EV182_001992 [Spiromyces aspiralis]|uniref:Uncharacterized protein n=1 Tax=Spiromyces aspiralis TaxID=68401 RepID=A0ACC1HVV7_9FUNG|nr:hypothetical protein EV182_001992 [Spiromyces aspiralis]